MLPVIDGRLLADHADHLVFVMTWQRTPKQLARRALRCLGTSQSKIVGVVMNGADPALIAEESGLGASAPRAGRMHAA
jgi:Mrp family chromosome partitioning ATPase